MLSARKRRVGFWFWVAILAIVTNPLLWRLLLNLFLMGVQFLGSHVPLP